jgi:hypothetical protein
MDTPTPRDPAPDDPAAADDDLTIPPTLDPIHADILREHLFEDAGLLSYALTTDAFDGLRVVYAITNPEQTEIIYVGDAEQSRNLRSRLRAHLKDREKIGHVEANSFVYVHVMITEFLVLNCFHEDVGRLPKCNKRKVGKHL